MAKMATAQVSVDASAEQVWRALTDPELIKQYMFGSEVTCDWEAGSPIRWKGEYNGNAYEDKGEVLEVKPGERLRVTHFSPFSGQPDVPENYHTVTYVLEESESGDATTLSLTQDGCSSDEEAEQFSQNWQSMLDGLKGVVERPA